MKLKDLKAKANNLKSQVLTVYFVSKDSRLPLHIKILAIFCVAYALSPIDFIPDFIPILGLLDDLIIIPLCLALIIRLTPREIIESARLKAEKSNIRPVNYLAGVLIVCIWISLLWFLASIYFK